MKPLIESPTEVEVAEMCEAERLAGKSNVIRRLAYQRDILATGVTNWANVAEKEHKEVEKLRAELASAYDKIKSDKVRMAPVQGYAAGIPWEMHLRAYDVYCAKYGKQQAMITGECRGGFHISELDEFIPGWREELSELVKLRADLASARKVIERVAELEPSLRIGVLSDTVILRVEYAMEWLKYHPT